MQQHNSHPTKNPSASLPNVIDSLSLAPASAQVPVRAASPTRTFFDPWNSSSTGHQRAANRLSGSTSWRDSRNLKLSEQYRSGLSGGKKRVADTVGAGSTDFGKDGRKANGGWEKGAKGLRTGGQKSLAELWNESKAHKRSSPDKSTTSLSSKLELAVSTTLSDEDPNYDTELAAEHQHDIGQPTSALTTKQIFSGLCFYTNGSTAPLVSDHKLKHMLAAHGARHSVALGRRSVTHVILGTTCARGGAGGGLAATKIQKEIARTGGKAVKFVTVEWVLESIKAERRLAESRFSPLKLAPPAQNSVLGMLRTTTNGDSSAPKGEFDQG